MRMGSRQPSSVSLANCMITLSAAGTALVFIDLQKGIVGRTLAPRSGESVVDSAKVLANFQIGMAARVVFRGWGVSLGDRLG